MNVDLDRKVICTCRNIDLIGVVSTDSTNRRHYAAVTWNLSSGGPPMQICLTTANQVADIPWDLPKDSFVGQSQSQK